MIIRIRFSKPGMEIEPSIAFFSIEGNHRSYENTVRMTILDPHIMAEELEGNNNKHKNEINKSF